MVDQLEAKDPSKQYPELDDLLSRDVLPQSRIRSYTERLDLDTSSVKHGHVFVNGKHFELDDVRDEDKVMMALWNRWIILNR